jgi:cytosine permease
MGTDAASTPSAALPDYITAAKPNPSSNRAPWYLTTAPTYASIFLWFAFWDTIPARGLAQGGLALMLLAILLGGLICYYLFYLVPGVLGMKTGLPLYIVGASTFGAKGSLIMPGFLMGLLQFCWLGVNTYYSSKLLAEAFGTSGSIVNPFFIVLCILFAGGAAFVGLKGIQYVGKVATYLPLIPLVVLILALVLVGFSGLKYVPEMPEPGGITPITAFLGMVSIIVGFFATAGAAGVDICMSNRNKGDVTQGGLAGIFLAIVVTAGVATLAVAGAQKEKILPDEDIIKDTRAKMEKEGKDEKAIKEQINVENFTVTNALKSKRTNLPSWLLFFIGIGLPIAAFPGACFSSFIAATSFKTVMPRVNPFLSVGVGALVSMVLAITGLAGNLEGVFVIIGASFGPICGAMLIDYALAGNRWAGPRAGFNPAGWAAWALGFIVGIMPNLHKLWPVIPDVAAAPVVAFFIGAVVYYALAKAGQVSPVIPYEPAQQQAS